MEGIKRSTDQDDVPCRDVISESIFFRNAWKMGERLFAYEYNGYWKDVGTLGSYWEANMELIDIIPEFNLYEEFWKIYTKSDAVPPLICIGRWIYRAKHCLRQFHN